MLFDCDILVPRAWAGETTVVCLRISGVAPIGSVAHDRNVIEHPCAGERHLQPFTFTAKINLTTLVSDSRFCLGVTLVRKVGGGQNFRSVSVSTLMLIDDAYDVTVLLTTVINRVGQKPPFYHQSLQSYLISKISKTVNFLVHPVNNCQVIVYKMCWYLNTSSVKWINFFSYGLQGNCYWRFRLFYCDIKKQGSVPLFKKWGSGPLVTLLSYAFGLILVAALLSVSSALNMDKVMWQSAVFPSAIIHYWFAVRSGVRQGCRIAPDLFLGLMATYCEHCSNAPAEYALKENIIIYYVYIYIIYCNNI